MSNETQKADQIAHRLYTKLALVVHNARVTLEPPPQVRLDKWFNLETPDPDIFREHTRIYRSISSAHATPPFQLQVLLSIPELTNNQVLVYHAPDSSRLRIDPTPRFILLESWDLVFSPNHTQPRNSEDPSDFAPSTMYKHGIPLFRSIFTLLRIIPAWKLARRLRRRTGGGRNGNFSIELRVQSGDMAGSTGGTLRFDTPPAPGAPLFAQEMRAFPAITHPTGLLTVSVTYLKTPNFQLDELESLLSSRFLSLDEGSEFIPTLARHQQRESLSGSPGSLPARTSLPRSPPSSSVADRFIIAPAMSSRTPSLPTVGGGSPRMQPMALPSVQYQSNTSAGAAGSVSGMSDGSSSRQGASISSRDETQPVSALAARFRRGSLGSGRSGDIASSPGPMPIRRPPVNPVYPFKSSTLSSGSPSFHSPSPSLRQHSPLGSLPGGPSLPSRPTHTSPTSSRLGISVAPGPSRTPSSPVTSIRPSPPFAPSSLGERRSLASAEGVLPGVAESPMSGKRYSSSFGLRYAATGGAGSDGSTESTAKEGERVAGASFLSTHTDDDDISAFVKDIDTRRPLIGVREHSTPEGPRDRGEEGSNAPQVAGGPLRHRTMSMPAPMLTTASDVDERLREMSEAFNTSLRGLGARRRARGGSSNEGRRSTGRAWPSDGIESPTAEGERVDVSGIPVPAAYVRPRLASTTSVRSGFSIASGEVLGRMDPELTDDTGRNEGH